MTYLKELLTQYKSIILYGIFGVLTTVVNIITYYLCYNIFNIHNLLSTAIAWFISVLFAFITNKIWVFESKLFSKEVIIKELVSFFSCRIATGLLDLSIMWFAVDYMNWNSLIWKMISNIIVIVLNYVASKIFVFKRKDT